jgi:plastocyanin
MRRTFGVLALACALVAAIAVANAGAAGKTAVIKTKGGDSLAPNKKAPPNLVDINDLQWAPGTITVHSGENVKIVDSDNAGDPHVLAIALPKDLPKSSNVGPSNPVLRLIAPKLLNNPQNPQAGFKAYESNAGTNGLNQEGESLVVLPSGPHKTATWFVSAKAGTTLHYFCAVHPWMQGVIKVIK